jgi:hypothetical protein
MNAHLAHFMFERYPEGFDCYNSADSCAEYGIHYAEFTCTNDHDIIHEAEQKWQKLSTSEKEELRREFISHCNNHIECLQQAIGEVESVVIP